MTAYSGSVAYFVDDPAFGDGDEPDFDVSANAFLNLSLSIDGSGNVTGVGAGSGSVSGFAEGDTDGDDDSFSGDLTGSTSVTGTVEAGVSMFYTTADGGFVEFEGTFNSNQTAITGTLTISDPGLGSDLEISLSLPVSSAPTTLTQTPMPADIDSRGELIDELIGGSVDQAAESALHYGLQYSQTVYGPLTSFPSGLKGAIEFLGGEVQGNARPWGNVGSAATSEALGTALALGGVFVASYQAASAAYQSGVFSTAAKQADAKLVAAVATGYVGQILTSGVVSGYVGGLLESTALTEATAGLVATAAGFVVPVAVAAVVGVAIYTVGTYLVNGQPQPVVDGVDFCGPQAVTTQAQSYLVPAPGGSQSALPAAAALSFGNAPLSYGAAAPQPAWSFDTSTGVFTWLMPSTAPLTQALSQLGVTQFATPLTITGGSGELITGGPLGDQITGAGNDLIIGGPGNNTINGGGAGNVIEGGTGTNTLTGGGADNTFVFAPGDSANTITDFSSSGGDKIDLSAFTTFHDFSQVMAAISQVGANTVIALGQGGSVTLANVAEGTLSAADFALAPLREDFYGAGASDVLIQNTAGAVVVGAVGTGDALTYAQVTGLGSEWQFHGTGNFLGGATSEFLIENTAGAVYAGEVVGGQTTYTLLANLGAEWKFVGAGDFLGEGHDQFLIENSLGAVYVGDYVNGQTAYTQVAGLGAEWSFRGAGDFLGDGKDQFLIENTIGQVFVGEVGTNDQASYAQIAGLGGEWTFDGTGDFLGDGKTDFLIENTIGQVFVGEVGSNNQASYTQIAGLGAGWKFVGTGDFLGHGHDEFLIENTIGQVYVGDWAGGQIHYTPIAALGSEWAFH